MVDYEWMPHGVYVLPQGSQEEPGVAWNAVVLYKHSAWGFQFTMEGSRSGPFSDNANELRLLAEDGLARMLIPYPTSTWTIVRNNPWRDEGERIDVGLYSIKSFDGVSIIRDEQGGRTKHKEIWLSKLSEREPTGFIHLWEAMSISACLVKDELENARFPYSGERRMSIVRFVDPLGNLLHEWDSEPPKGTNYRSYRWDHLRETMENVHGWLQLYSGIADNDRTNRFRCGQRFYEMLTTMRFFGAGNVNIYSHKVELDWNLDPMTVVVGTDDLELCIALAARAHRGDYSF